MGDPAQSARDRRAGELYAADHRRDDHAAQYWPQVPEHVRAEYLDKADNEMADAAGQEN